MNKKIEDLTKSVQSLTNVVSSSFHYAKNSPLRAKQSLYSAAEYLQSFGRKGTESSVAIIAFVLTLVDLLKNENVEHLVVSFISLLENIVKILRTEECQNLIKSLLIFVSSAPVSAILQSVGKLFVHFIYILRTEEIGVIIRQLYQILDALRPEEKSDKHCKIKEDGDENKVVEEKDVKTLPHNKNMDDNANNEKMKPKSTESLSPQSKNSWYGLSIFSNFVSNSVQDEGEDNNPNLQVNKNLGRYLQTPSKHKFDSDNLLTNQSKPLEKNIEIDAVRNDYSDETQEEEEEEEDNGRLGWYEFEGDEEEKIAYYEKRSDTTHSNKTSQSSNSMSLSDSCHSNTFHYRSAQKGIFSKPVYKRQDDMTFATLRDWMQLIDTIDKLEDSGLITLVEGDEFRKMSRMRDLELLIMYKSYSNRLHKFVRNARKIIEDRQNKERNIKFKNELVGSNFNLGKEGIESNDIVENEEIHDVSNKEI